MKKILYLNFLLVFMIPLKLYSQENSYLNWINNPPYIPDYKATETSFNLNLERSSYKYSGYVYCQVIIDAQLKKMEFDSIVGVKLINNINNDTVFWSIFTSEKYNEKYPEFLYYVSPILDSFVKTIPLKECYKYTDKTFRYSKYSIPIIVK